MPQARRLLPVVTLALAACASASSGGVPAAAVPAEPTTDTLTIQTPVGPVEGLLVLPGGARGRVPVVLLHVGSGPTLRDGTSAAGPDNFFAQLADSLVRRGIGSLRYDKRGFGASAAARVREEELRFEMLADDAAEWVRTLRADRRVGPIVLAGHSEGALVLALAQRQAKADAYVSIAGAGRPADVVVREQLARQLPPALLEQADSIIASLRRGETVADTPPILAALFRPSVQPYIISWLRYDPAALVAEMDVPILIVHGTADIQVSELDARLLADANPRARLVLIEGMNHVFKMPAEDDPRRGYVQPELPISTELVEALATFVTSL